MLRRLVMGLSFAVAIVKLQWAQVQKHVFERGLFKLLNRSRE